jgi:hypothetical protein
VVTAPPAAPCDNVNAAAHTGALVYAHGTDSMGRPIQLTLDSVF